MKPQPGRSLYRIAEGSSGWSLSLTFSCRVGAGIVQETGPGKCKAQDFCIGETLRGRGGLAEQGGSMLKLKHSSGNMGLSLTCSFQELATRTETSEQQAGRGSLSQRWLGVGGWVGVGCEREHTNAPLVDWATSEGGLCRHFVMRLMAFVFACHAHPTVSHKVAAECLSSPDYALTGTM